MGLEEVLDRLRYSRKAPYFTHQRFLQGQAGESVEFPTEMPQALRGMLERAGISRLYSHQAEAYRCVLSGGNPVIVTPTASGKTLCYNLPVLHRLLERPDARSLYLFPAKALSQDQFQALLRLTDGLENAPTAAVYDGDTPSDRRAQIRRSTRIVLTNPDMLHAAILPHHTKWSLLFAKLEIVVIDELHQYRGVFGSHLGNVIRRLRRICRFYGSSPQFILSSATLANPKDLAERITGTAAQVIDRSGAPSGDKLFLFYNPPIVDAQEGIRRSYLAEAFDFAKLFFEQGIQSIIFTRSRLTVEILVNELKRALNDPPSGGQIRGYRGGYLAQERRDIEQGLRSGDIRAVVATSALELGVDIGDLQVAVMAGYPGSISSAWQRAGRAGRRDQLSAAILIASAMALDQFIIRNPAYFFDTPPELGLVNPDNLLILLAHITCAAFEMPFQDDEVFSDSLPMGDFYQFLQEEGKLVRSAAGWHYCGERYPAESVSLRTVSADRCRIVRIDAGRKQMIAEVDAVSAAFHVHPGAIYLHEGRQYRVESLDQTALEAVVTPVAEDYYTMPVEQTRIDIVAIKAELGNRPRIIAGDLLVTTRVIGYKKLKFHTMENLGNGVLTLPDQEMTTSGVWFEIPVHDMASDLRCDTQELVSGMAGSLIAIHSASAALLMCEPRDLGVSLATAGGAWTAPLDPFGGQTFQAPMHVIAGVSAMHMFLFDRYPGGIGLSDQLYGAGPDIVRAAYDLVSRCDCRYGCPGCIGPTNQPRSSLKPLAINFLADLSRRLTRPVDVR